MTSLDALAAQIDLYHWGMAEDRKYSHVNTRVASRAYDMDKIPARIVDRAATAPGITQEALDLFKSLAITTIKMTESAETYYVADWIVDTLEDAVETFPTEYEPHLTVLPSDSGFCLLQRPYTLATRPTNDMIIDVIAWRREGSKINVAGFGINPDEPLAKRELKTFHTLHLGVPIRDSVILAEDWKHKTYYYDVDPYDRDKLTKHDVDQAVYVGMREAERRFEIHFVCSLWLFLGERIVRLDTQQAPRGIRRSMERERLPFEPRVTTILLRSVDYSGATAHTAAHSGYETRWVVRGHWHRFWVGKKDGSEERRLVPRWVSAYVKGPDGAPLNAPIKLFSATR